MRNGVLRACRWSQRDRAREIVEERGRSMTIERDEWSSATSFNKISDDFYSFKIVQTRVSAHVNVCVCASVCVCWCFACGEIAFRTPNTANPKSLTVKINVGQVDRNHRDCETNSRQDNRPYNGSAQRLCIIEYIGTCSICANLLAKPLSTNGIKTNWPYPTYTHAY